MDIRDGVRVVTKLLCFRGVASGDLRRVRGCGVAAIGPRYTPAPLRFERLSIPSGSARLGAGRATKPRRKHLLGELQERSRPISKLSTATVTYVLIASLLTFALTEVGARLWLTRVADDDVFHAYASLDQMRDRADRSGVSLTMFDRHLYVGFVGSKGFRRGLNRHNAHGYRGNEITVPKPADEFRIVCLGGSTTYTSFVEDHRFSYPAQLEQNLNERGYTHARVINAGLPGWTSYESLVNFQFRVLDLEPDMIVVYHAVNDVVGRFVWPPGRYRGDNSGAKLPSSGLDRPVGLLERSTLIRTLLTRFGAMESVNALDRTFVRIAPSAHGMNFVVQVARETFPSGIFKNVDPARMLASNPPTYFRRNLENLVVVAKQAGVIPVLATFAYAHDRYGERGMGRPEFQRGMDEMNAVTREVGDASGAIVFDFVKKFPDVMFVDPVHVGLEGATLKARLFADFLIDTGLIPVSTETGEHGG